VINLDEDAKDEGSLPLQSLPNAQLIRILQHHDGDHDLTQMVEDELARRKTALMIQPTPDPAGCTSRPPRVA
jgi:hypothetical protein